MAASKEIAICRAGGAPFILGVIDVVARSVTGTHVVANFVHATRLEDVSLLVRVVGAGVVVAALHGRGRTGIVARCDGCGCADDFLVNTSPSDAWFAVTSVVLAATVARSASASLVLALIAGAQV
jgi:hypothetical protein